MEDRIVMLLSLTFPFNANWVTEVRFGLSPKVILDSTANQVDFLWSNMLRNVVQTWKFLLFGGKKGLGGAYELLSSPSPPRSYCISHLLSIVTTTVLFLSLSFTLWLDIYFIQLCFFSCLSLVLLAMSSSLQKDDAEEMQAKNWITKNRFRLFSSWISGHR